MISANKSDKEVAATAARHLYEKGVSASEIVRRLKNGGHPLVAVAFAARHLPPIDAMLFGESWGGDDVEQHAARFAFLDLSRPEDCPETGAWYCPQCGYVDGQCDPIMGSEFDHGHQVCDAEFYSDAEELAR